MTELLTAPARARPRPDGRPGAAPVIDLHRHAGRTAIRTATDEISYAALARRSAELAGSVLGGARRLVLVEGGNTPEAITAYLAALNHGHVALLVPDGRPDQRAAMVAAYDPDVVLHTDGSAVVRRDDSAHELHPDLALLLSTSGSTGSPKLVRLSRHSVRSNAASIADFLRLTPADRAATSLPMHYCYGLSVVNSHLASGAGLVLSDLSVVDECFWELFDAAGATSFAGVPYTFELLDRSGFADRQLPSLRYVTQAGGRLAPETVRRYAGLGARDGWDLVVMYGQTEATARMAWLPPALAHDRPAAIGIPVPGGSFRLDPVPECTEEGAGELVYRGPNVMMGYAEGPADLAGGHDLAELRTGDLAREVDGLLEIVGRRNRQAKVFGLRIDLDRVERLVSTPQAPVRCVVADETVHAFTTRARATGTVHQAITALCGLPSGAVHVHAVAAFPTTATGKPDLAALARQAELHSSPSLPREGGPVTPAALRDELALVLGRPDATLDTSFATLGGDSLSYVELATRLGDRLGELPASWHTLTPRELAAHHRAAAATATGRRRGTRVDTTVALRALAILLIVGTHANLVTLMGGAHVLLAVAGFNLARFTLADVPRRARVRNGLASVAQVVVPSTLFIGAVSVVTGMYDPATALFLNGLLGDDGWTVQWQFWFLEALVWCSLGIVALTAVPALDRLERRTPYAVAVVLLGVTLALRYAWTGLEAGATERYTPALVLWFVAAGWAAARATRPRERLLALVVVGAGVWGFFGDPLREGVVLAGLAVLVLAPTVRLPRALAAPVGVLASASLYVYLTHWQVYPHLEWDHPLLATLLSLAVGIGYARLARPGTQALGRLLRGDATRT